MSGHDSTSTPTVKRAYLDTPDGQLHYRWLGGRGPAVLFLHQVPSSSRMFEPLMRAFAAEGYRTFALDMPGFGESHRPKPGFEIAVTMACKVCDDVAAGLAPVKAMLGFYIGGMGAKKQNFHKDLMARMGFEAEADKIQDLFFQGKRNEAIAAVPDQFADEISLVGPLARIRDRLAAWRETPVTTLLVSTQDKAQLRTFAELVLGK